MKPGAGPSATPETSTMNVTGLKLGSEANSTRPAVANAARAAISDSSLALESRRP